MQNRTALENFHLLLGVIGVLAPAATLAIALSELAEISKIIALALIAVFSFLVCVYSYLNLSRGGSEQGGQADARSDVAATTRIAAINIDNWTFSKSMRLTDVFLEVSKNIEATIPLRAAGIFITDANGDLPAATHVYCPQAGELEAGIPTGAAELSARTGEIETATEQHGAVVGSIEQNTGASAAIPLKLEGRVFAVYQIITDVSFAKDVTSQQVLSAISKTITPLLTGAVTVERSLSSALTDVVTGLPNERAFAVVLETQLAECRRRFGDRPLSLLSIDIENGPDSEDAARASNVPLADQDVRSAADTIKSQLRTMDFLSRSSDEGFLAVLPNTREETAAIIARRIMKKMDGFRGENAAGGKGPRIAIGWSSFCTDGETAEDLLRAARVRKQMAEADERLKAQITEQDYVH